VVLHGSVYDCQSPVFLRFSKPEEETKALDDPLTHVIEEVEIESPDLDVLGGLDSAPAKPAPITKPAIAPLAAATIAGAVAGIGTAQQVQATSPQPAAAFSGGQDSSPAWLEEEEPAAFLSNGEEAPSFALAEEDRELPSDLADISDLAPPEQTVEFVEGEDDFELDLDLDLGFNLQGIEDDTEFEEEETVVAAPSSRKEQAAPVNMDADLDFELDLGGLSLHDYGSDRK